MVEIYGIRPRDRMPLHTARLSERNPSNAGWLRFWNFADSSGGHAPRELTGARKDSWTFRANAKRGGGPLGPGLYTGGGNYDQGGAYCDDSYRTSIGSSLTAMVLYTSVSSTNSEFIFGNTSLITGGDYNWGIYRSHSTATIAAFVKNSGGTAVSAAGALNLIPIGKTVLAAMTYDGATIRAYIDGIQVASAAQTGNVRTTDLNTTLCDWYGATQSQAVWAYYAGIANRVWSPDELLAVGENWFSIFDEEEEPVFYSLPTGGGGSVPPLYFHRTQHGMS